jgi:GNAT superfamily N-acetyltransferase
MRYGDLDEPSVREVTPGDVPALSAAMARAFEDDPVYEWFLPDARTRLARMIQLNEIMFRRIMPLDSFELYTTDDCAGVAIWAGKERWELPNRVMLTAIPRLLRIMRVGGVRKMTAAMSAMKKAHPKEPHWYLMGLGTDPPKQGTGVGTALVNRILARCDGERLPAYLETQKAQNVPYYEKFGFRVTDEIDLPLGGPHLWLMWREPM